MLVQCHISPILFFALPLDLPAAAAATTTTTTCRFSPYRLFHQCSILIIYVSTIDAVWSYQLTAQLNKILRGTLESNFINRYLFKDRPATPRVIGSPFVMNCKYEEQIVSYKTSGLYPIALVPILCSADPKVSATSSQGILGYISVMATLKFDCF